MDGYNFQVQWKTRRHWKVGPAFRTRKEANEYVELRRWGVETVSRVFDLGSSRLLTDQELTLLLNIAHTERRNWQRRVVKYFRSGHKLLLDRTDEDYAMLDVISQEYSIVAFDGLSIRGLRDMIEERVVRSEAIEKYASDEIEIDENARVSKGGGGSFVQAWVWVPERISAGVDDGCFEAD